MTAPGKEAGLSIGVVSDRKDPDAIGRVKVRFPTLADRESDWLPVAMPFGGSKPEAHGFFWVPEEGDHVVVGYENGDPKSGIVLGSIYSKALKPPVNDRDVRMIRTTKNHVIKIEETPGSIQLLTAKGQKIVLDDQSGDVHVEGTTSVSIKGAQTVTIEGGASVTVKAPSVVVDSPSVTLGGSAGVEPAVLGTQFATLFASHFHTSSVPGTPTSPPLNAAQATAALSTAVKLAK